MKKTKKYDLSIIPVIAVIAVIGFVITSGIVSAVYSSNVGNAENVYITNETPQVGGMLGGVTNYDSLTLSDDLVVGGTTDMSRLTQGGSILATSTADVATGVLTEAQLIANVAMDLTLTGDCTHILTLPATSTLTSFIPNAGDTAIFNVRAIGGAAVASTTITAGTGMDLIEPENGDVVIEAGNEAQITLRRESDTDVTVSVVEFIAAD